MNPRNENPAMETHTEFLRRKLKKVGHFALSRWMQKKGYSFKYAYFIVFNALPKR